jgi:hypothetical protein
MSRRAVDQQRAELMEGLARLYDEQANELETGATSTFMSSWVSAAP